MQTDSDTNELSNKLQKLETLFEAQQLSLNSLGCRTAKAAHDLNNILGTILGYAEILEEELSDRKNLVELVRVIRKAGEQGTELSSTLFDIKYESANNSEK